MFDQTQRALALNFARTLSQRDYSAAHQMCSNNQKSRVSVDHLREEFERIIPLDWGSIDPVELEEHDDFPFIYVVLGGDVYSEAIIIDTFITEDGIIKIDNFEFGRP